MNITTIDNILIAYANKVFINIKHIRNPIKNYWYFIFHIHLKTNYINRYYGILCYLISSYMYQ